MTFWTDRGTEVPAVSAAQMKELDRIAVSQTGPGLLQMMENAGRNLAESVMEVLGEGWADSRIVVLAGPGGNGGGGICAARHLANRFARVILCLSDRDRLRETTVAQLAIYRNTEGLWAEPDELDLVAPDLVVDALIGYGLQGVLRDGALRLIRWANHQEAPIFSLDVPSGIDATNGYSGGEFIRPRWTMTLALPKTGLASVECGELILADIGIPGAAFQQIGFEFRNPFGNRFRVPLHDSPMSCGTV